SSQSQRILWLLEELGIEYSLINHERNSPTGPRPFLSPPSLVDAVPYGKAPTLVTGAKDGSRIIPESSAIATYLIRTFDTEDKFGLRNGDWIRDEVICSMLSTNINRVSGIALFLDFGAIKLAEGPVGDRFKGKALWGPLGDLEKELKGAPKGGYFMGEHPGRADILVEWQLSFAKQRKWVDLESDFPLLHAWLERVYARDAWKRAMKKGNGYDLTIFPKIPERL
ncbi:hypothetical protein LSUE1_G003350, partial [Lachnellula suecica]